MAENTNSRRTDLACSFVVSIRTVQQEPVFGGSEAVLGARLYPALYHALRDAVLPMECIVRFSRIWSAHVPYDIAYSAGLHTVKQSTVVRSLLPPVGDGGSTFGR